LNILEVKNDSSIQSHAHLKVARRKGNEKQDSNDIINEMKSI
jgi:hypothetical protein